MNLFYFHAAHHYFTHLRESWNRRALPPASRPEWFLDYFYTRGISDAIIAESGAIPLTPLPSRAECAAYKRFMHRARLSKETGAPDPIVEGILFPFFVDPVDFGTFGVCRALFLTRKFEEYYEHKGDKIPKLISPTKESVKASSHLYILPSEQAKLTKSSIDLCLIEGQAKTLKLIQDLRTAGLADQFCVLGVNGVDQFLSAPETHTLPWRNRGVYIFFDADSLRKPEVAQAEIKAAAYCLARGAHFVKSCTWKADRGNGYDDHAVLAAQKGFPPEINLPTLIKKAKETFEKYAPTDEAPGLPIDTVCRAIAKTPGLLQHQKTVILSRLAKLYKSAGLKPKEVKEVFDQQLAHIRQEQQEQKIKENGDILQRLFDIPYVPDMPANYQIMNGYLHHLDLPLCRTFCIKKYIATEDPERNDYYLLAFQGGKEILIPSDQFSNYRMIAQIFNRNQEILCDETARLAQRYIAQYWNKNRHKPIPIVPMFENTGWDKTGFFRIPTRDGESEYTPSVKQAFICSGDPEIQRAFVRQIMTDHPAALILLLGFLTPMIGLLNLNPIVVMIYGNPGDGKSTAAFAALSLYGQWDRLYQSMNATKVGKEVTFSMSKDLPVLLDELNTAGNGDGRVIAQQVIETIYGFHSGKGRTRSNIHITLAKQHEYQGLLMMTSERSLETIFSVMTNMNIGGAYRRTLEIPVLTPHTLWNYKGTERETFFREIYDNINHHYGYVGAAWLDFLSAPEIQNRVKQDYHTCLKEQGNRGIELKGTDHLIALIEAICPHVETFLSIKSGEIWKNIKDYVTLIVDQQQRQIDFQVKNTVEKFVDALNSFISSHPLTFDGIAPATATLTCIYGKVIDSAPDDDNQRWRHIFLRPQGLKDLCNLYGFDRNGMLVQLKEAEIFKPFSTTITNKKGEKETIYKDYKSMRIRETGGDVYRFVIPAPKDQEGLVEQNEPAEKNIF